MSQEDESTDQPNKPQDDQKTKKTSKVQNMKSPQIVSKNRIVLDRENTFSKRGRQRNKRNKLKQTTQNWKLYYNNRHKNNNGALGNGLKNHKEELKPNNNIRPRNIFLNATFTMGRKRSMTFPGISKFFLPYKRPRKECIIPPTKFLLGGNISDPLNLNSLHDEENGSNKVAEVPAVTPEEMKETSPKEDKWERRNSTTCKNDEQKVKVEANIKTEPADENLTHNSQQQQPVTNPVIPAIQPSDRVQVIVPPNMFDPLNLLHPHEEEEEYEKKISLSGKKKARSRSNRKRRASKANISNSSNQDGNSSTTSLDTSENKDFSDIFDSIELIKKECEEEDIDSDQLKISTVTTPCTQDSSESVDSLLISTPTTVNTISSNASNSSKELKLDLNIACSLKSNALTKDGANGQRKQRRLDSMDKIVSPVIPQPGAWMRPHRVDRGGQRVNWRGRGRGRGASGSSALTSTCTSLSSTLDTASETLDITFNSSGSDNSSAEVAPVAQESPNICLGDESNKPNDSSAENNSVNSPDSQNQNVVVDINTKMPKIKKDGYKYRFGNYDRYYGYRNLNESMDVRLKVFQMHRHLFQGKDILDIGCNVGHVSMCVARDLGAKTVTGIDIDGNLIERAKKNLRQCVTIFKRPTAPPTATITKQGLIENNKIETTKNNQCDTTNIECNQTNKENSAEKILDRNVETSAKSPNNCDTELKKEENNTRKTSKLSKLSKFSKFKKNRSVMTGGDNYFPISFPLLYGPVDVLDNTKVESTAQFPHNVIFKHANYVLKDDNLISAEPAQYDLILCLSVSKWLHLNNGDAGLKRAFKRMFAQLRPGGKLILEAQNWASYKKKKNLTETIYKNYSTIEFYPCKFRDFLLSPEVGFSQCSILGVPQHLSKGFRRPIQLYIKGDFTPSQAMWSDTRMPSASQYGQQTTTPIAKRPVYTAPLPDFKSGEMFSYWGSTPYSMASHHTNNIFDTSPFYAPGSGSYTPSYSEGQHNVYAPTCGSRWSSPATSGTPSQSPAQFLDLTPNATPNATPRGNTPGSAGLHDPNQGRNVTRVYAAVSPVPGTSYHQSHSPPHYLPQWNENNSDYYAVEQSPNANVYCTQEDTSSNDHLITNESSSASIENSPSVNSASFRSGDSPSTHDDVSILNGHANASSPNADSSTTSPTSNS